MNMHNFKAETEGAHVAVASHIRRYAILLLISHGIKSTASDFSPVT